MSVNLLVVPCLCSAGGVLNNAAVEQQLLNGLPDDVADDDDDDDDNDSDADVSYQLGSSVEPITMVSSDDSDLD